MAIVTEQQKRKHIRDYFRDSRTPLAWALILFGIPAIAIYLIGIPMIIAGLFLLWRKKKLTSDEQIDAWTAAELARHDFVGRARQLTGFAQEVRPPVVLTGSANEDLRRDVFSGQRWGDDGKSRETPLSAAVILCSPDQLGIYQTGIDLTTGNRVNEVVYEAFYQDVVSINIAARSESIDLDEASRQLGFWGTLNPAEIQKGLTKAKVKMNIAGIKSRFSEHIVNNVFQWERLKEYRIRLSNGEPIVLPISDRRPTRVANESDDATLSETARSMIALRAFVRDKKRQIIAQAAGGGGPLI